MNPKNKGTVCLLKTKSLHWDHLLYSVAAGKARMDQLWKKNASMFQILAVHTSPIFQGMLQKVAKLAIHSS